MSRIFWWDARSNIHDFHKGDNIFTWWISAIKRNDNVLEASWREKFLYKSTSKAIVHWKIYIYVYTHTHTCVRVEGCEAFPLCRMKYAWNQEVWWKISWRNLFHIFHCNDSFARDSISITGKIQEISIYTLYSSPNYINFQKCWKHLREIRIYNVINTFLLLSSICTSFTSLSIRATLVKRWKL